MKEKILKGIKNFFWLSCEDGQNKKEIYAFNAMRFIAFLFIFSFHAKTFIKTPMLHQADIGVSFFIIVSGFLNGYLKKGIEKINLKNIAKYTKRKFSKIYPLLLFVILILLPRIGLFNITNWGNFGKFLSRFIPAITLTSSWFNHENYYYAFFGGIWYISTFFFLVVLTPILLKIIYKIRESKKGPIKLLLLALVLFALSMAWVSFVNKEYFFVYIFPPARLFEYIIGIIFGTLMRTCKIDKKIKKLSITHQKTIYSILEIISIAIIVLCAILVQTLGEQNLPNYISKHMVVYTLPIAFLLCVFVKQKGIVSLLLSNKPMVLFGRASMYSYLIHMPILYLMKRDVAHETLYGIFLLTITLIISVYIYKRSNKNENRPARTQ